LRDIVEVPFYTIFFEGVYGLLQLLYNSSLLTTWTDEKIYILLPKIIQINVWHHSSGVNLRTQDPRVRKRICYFGNWFTRDVVKIKRDSKLFKFGV